MRFSSLFAGVAWLAASVSAYSNPLTCSGTCTNTHDPAIIRRASDGTYFRFATGGGIAIHKASTIQGPWTYQGYALADGSSIDNSGADDMWAPDVTLIGSTYYMYYAVSDFGTQNSVIGLATSTTMEVGSWTDHGTTGLSSSSAKAYNAIDPNLLKVGNGYYMNFGSFWHDLYQCTMKTTPTAVQSSSYNIAYNASSDHAMEGSYMIAYGSYYYLFFSSGQCCGLDTSPPAAGDEYHIMVCRSTVATGGFVDAKGVSCTESGGTMVLPSHGNIYAPGGQGVYDDPSLGWVLYYHYFDKTIGIADGDALLGINKISWSTGWPVV